MTGLRRTRRFLPGAVLGHLLPNERSEERHK
jgi:hypothetical protein